MKDGGHAVCVAVGVSVGVGVFGRGFTWYVWMSLRLLIHTDTCWKLAYIPEKELVCMGMCDSRDRIYARR